MYKENMIQRIIDSFPLYPQCIMRRIYCRVSNPKKFFFLQYLRENFSEHGYTFKPFLEKKCIFVHIPKCAGVSINKCLFGNLAGGHRTIRDYQIAFKPREFVSFFKFTVVRNPWDRLFSAYNFLRAGGFNEADRLWASKNLSAFSNFNEFVLNWLNEKNVFSYIHFRPQYYYVCIKSKPLVDYILHFENLSQDFENFCNFLNINNRLKHYNKKNHVHYVKIYTKETIDIVQKVYRKDIEIFKYQYEQ